MPILSEQSRSLRARVAAATTNRNVSPEALAALRQEFHAASIADHLSARLAAAPPLTAAQYDGLHAVIRRHRLQAAS
ncbi:MAG: hypothetical protein ABIQ01_00720 [Pseudolysinimonas sp.]